MCRLGFSPRKAELVLYVLTDGSAGRRRCSRGSASTRPASAASTSRSLSDVDEAVLEELTVEALAYMDEKYPR